MYIVCRGYTIIIYIELGNEKGGFRAALVFYFSQLSISDFK